MKKKLLTLLFLVPLLAQAQIQTFEGNWTVPTGAAGSGGPPGWAIADAGGPAQKWEQGTNGSYAGNHHAVLLPENVANGTTSEDWLITPAITVPVDGALSFYSKLATLGDQGNTYKILVKSAVGTGSLTEQLALANYGPTPVAQWTELQINPTQTAWTHKAVSLAAYAGTNVYIAFVMQGDAGDSWMIDNVSVTSSCPQPTNIIITNITTTSATVSWTSPPGVTSWEVEIVPVGSQPTGFGIVTTSNPFTFSNITGGAYSVYVRSVCGDNVPGIWLGPYNVSIPVCSPTQQCNYTFNLSDSGGNGWNGNSMNVKQNGVTVAVLSLASGSTGTVNVPLCDSAPFELFWNATGAAPQEVGVSIVNAYLQTIYSKPAGTGSQNTLLFQDQAQCMQDACYAPYNVVATVLGTTATVSWNGATTGQWQYYLAETGAAAPVPNTVPTGYTTVNPLILNNLDPETAYTIYVRKLCPGFGGATIYSQWSPAQFIVGTGNYVTGTVTVDANGDGLCNGTADFPVPGIELTATVGTGAPFSIFANAQGQYIIDDIEDGTAIPVTVQPLVPSGFGAVAAVNQNVTFPANTAQQINFCLPLPATVVNDIEVILVPLNNPQSGFYAHYSLIVQNNGPIEATGVTVALDYPASFTSVYTINRPFTVTDATTILITVGNINPYGTAATDIWLQVLPPPATIGGEPLVFACFADMDATDQVIVNNSYALTQTVVNSYDPNDITVHEGAQIPMSAQVEYLHYTIRFQNTGSAPAVNVRLENELDENLDWNTFDPIAASHNFTASRVEGNNVTFRFDNIFLADSTSNEPASHGFITYRIKPKATIAEGDVVSNTAGIFFDFNEAIVTNTVTSTFYAVQSIQDNERTKVLLYPNPVTDVLHINALQSMLQAVTVYDINGRLCLTSGTQDAVDTHALAPGIYMVKVTTDAGTSSYKLVKQ